MFPALVAAEFDAEFDSDPDEVCAFTVGLDTEADCDAELAPDVVVVSVVTVGLDTAEDPDIDPDTAPDDVLFVFVVTGLATDEEPEPDIAPAFELAVWARACTGASMTTAAMAAELSRTDFMARLPLSQVDLPFRGGGIAPTLPRLDGMWSQGADPVPLPEPKPVPKAPARPPLPSRREVVSEPPRLLELVVTVWTSPGPGTKTLEAEALPVDALPARTLVITAPPEEGAMATLPPNEVDDDEPLADWANAGEAVSATAAPATRKMDLRIKLSIFTESAQKGAHNPAPGAGALLPKPEAALVPP